MTLYVIRQQPIHVVEEGHPHRQVALLVHGWSSSWYAMSPLVELLSRRYRCLAVDLPGYGKSPPFPHKTTIAAYADLLADLIAHVSRGPVVYVGHSMGGMIGLTLALRHPMLIERLVLLGPTISGRLSPFINLFVSPVTLLERFGLGRLIVSGVERAFVGVTDRLMRPASFAERTEITERDYRRLRADARQPGQGRVRAECYFAMRENDLRGRLRDLQVPGLVIWGAEDNTVPLRDAGVVADEWPQADLRILPKAGHWPHFEQPLLTRRLIAAYLGLPLLTQEHYVPAGDETMAQFTAIAHFLAHSDLGQHLNANQRLRVASQMRIRHLNPGEILVAAGERSEDLFLLWRGSLELWREATHTHGGPPRRRVAVVSPGHLIGELGFLDGEPHFEDVLAGPEGAVVLALSRQRLLALAEDDAVLGTRLLLNLAQAVSRRARYALWQTDRLQAAAQVEDTLIGFPTERLRRPPSTFYTQ